ncbi:hypothetical protein CC1G_04038 [Coprinopsis cinerea okayama7|uniref:F-box domain-containing protein n=1 Tax=Coprinopsis cinerea (strain Okayama-7 / 130 / ATCC MYA-4618 / FGSC 9003) TaxID=240176 RepID=A8N8J1_COPC7|nr:hypothetical protein CC1G_04038 [Coprinopsis cinerea okayama7\|eukprot:XP_001831147.1 hypothetical protein CC1G_04038 [Coprinopsis cinerea okayama7\
MTAQALPLEIVTSIARFCPRDAWVPLLLVNRSFKSAAEALLYRSITLVLDNTSAGRDKAFACLRALGNPEKAKMVKRLKIVMSEPMMALANRILACADLMDNLKHLRLESHMWGDYHDEPVFSEFPSKLLCRSNFQLSSFGYYPWYTELVGSNDALINYQQGLEVIVLWGHFSFFRQDMREIIQVVQWAAGNTVDSDALLEPYDLPEDPECRLPIICALGGSTEEYFLCLFPELYATEEDKLRICPLASIILDLEDNGTKKAKTSVLELQRFLESVVTSFPALKELFIYTEFTPDTDHGRLREGLLPLSRVPLVRLSIQEWSSGPSDDHAHDPMYPRLKATEQLPLAEYWGTHFPDLAYLCVLDCVMEFVKLM